MTYSILLILYFINSSGPMWESFEFNPHTIADFIILVHFRHPVQEMILLRISIIEIGNVTNLKLLSPEHPHISLPKLFSLTGKKYEHVSKSLQGTAVQ